MTSWIRVEDDMPKEYDSIFKSFYGTNRWTKSMFRSLSDRVIVAYSDSKGVMRVTTGHTVDGSWKVDGLRIVHPVTHWMPMPEPPERK